MKVAITYENGEVFQHFGHTEKLKIYEIENEEIISENILDTSAHGHELLVKFLKDNNVEVLELCDVIDIKTIENDNTNSEQLLFVVILIKASKKAFIQT